MHNTGDGALHIASTINTTSHPISAVIGDINQDHKVEMVTINKDTNSIEIFTNKDHDEWQKTQTYQVDFDLCQILLRNVDTAGKLDIVVSSCQTNSFGLLRNLDGEHFTAPARYLTRSSPIEITQINTDEKNDPIHIIQKSGVGILQSVCH